LRGPSFGSGNRYGGVTAMADRHHQAGLVVLDAVDGHSGEGRGDQLVDEVRIAAAQVVGQVADDSLLAQLLLYFRGEILRRC